MGDNTSNIANTIAIMIRDLLTLCWVSIEGEKVARKTNEIISSQPAQLYTAVNTARSM